MFNYISSELFRLRHKKNNYIYFVLLVVAFISLILVASKDFDDNIENYLETGKIVVMLLPIFLGLHVYLSVFNDDKSNNVASDILCTGVSKWGMIIGKIIVFAIYYITFSFCLSLIYILGFLVLYQGFNGLNIEVVKRLIGSAAFGLLGLLAFVSFSGIVYYKTNKGSAALITLILVVVGVINQILTLIINLLNIDVLKEMLKYTITNQVDSGINIVLKDELPATQIIGLSVIIVVSVVISIIIMNRKDQTLG